MDRTGRIVRAARRRMTAAAVLDAAGRGLAWGAVVGLIGVGLSRVVSVPVEWWVLLGAPIGVGAFVGTVVGLGRRGTLLGAAGVVDHKLRLKDRLGTATALGGDARGDVFAELAVSDAEEASGRVDPARAVPIRLGRSWMVWPTAAVIGVAAGLWLPAMDLLRSSSRPSGGDSAARSSVDSKLSELAKATARNPAELARPGATAAGDESSRVLDEIRKELESGKASPEKAAERGARELDRIAGERERRAESIERAREKVDEAVRAMKKPDGPESELAKAVRSGDMAAAADAARELLNSSPEGVDSEAAREKAAKELDQLARDLRAAAKAREDAEKIANDAQKGERGTQIERPEGSERAHQGGSQEPQSDKRESPEAKPATDAAEELARSIERAAEAMKREHAKESPDRPPSPAEEKNGGDSSETGKDAPKPKPPAAGDSTTSRDAGKEQAAGSKSEQRSTEAQPSDAEKQGKRGADGKGKKPSDPGELTEKTPTSGKQHEPESNKSSSSGRSPQPEHAPDRREEQDSASRRDQQGEKPASEEKGSPAKSGPEKVSTGEKKEKTENAEKPSPGKPGTQAEPSKEKQSSDQRGGQKEKQAADKQTGEKQGEKKPSDGTCDNPGGQGQGKPDQAAGGDKSKRGESPSEGNRAAGNEPNRDGGTQKQEPRTGEREGTGDKPVDGSREVEGAKSESGAREPGKRREGGNPESDASEQGAPAIPKEMPSKEAVRRMADQLKKLANAPKDAAEQRKQAQKMRQQADELLRSATPDQKEQLRRWGQELAKEMQKDGGPPREDGGPDKASEGADPQGSRSADRGTPDPAGRSSERRASSREPLATTEMETVDARPKTETRRSEKPQERVIAEWYADRKTVPGDAGVAAGEGDAESSARAAAREGERAVESQAVPSRFDKLLLKYFQRLPDRAKGQGAAGTGTPVAPASKPEEAAQDAGTGTGKR